MSLGNTIHGSGSFSGNGSFYIQPILPTVFGGTLTSDSTYYYRTFLNNGTLTVSNANLTADVLMIAGGGAAVTAGGGAGGLQYLQNQIVTQGSKNILIGAGGSLDQWWNALNGNNTSFDGFDDSIGGGHGAAPRDQNGYYTRSRSGANGGSGGGAEFYGSPGQGISGQGHNGGPVGFTSSGEPVGGGGGAGEEGHPCDQLHERNGMWGWQVPFPGGGNGLYFDDFGSATSTGEHIDNHYYYAGGGGNSYRNWTAVGGYGGGGTNHYIGDPTGKPNTGGGAAGGSTGGSGLVIVRYTKQSVGG